MPQIGSIIVPDALFEKLVEDTVRGFASSLFQEVEQEISGINLSDEKELINNEFPADHEILVQCVSSLVRIHRNDYVSTDREIQSLDEYRDIWREAYGLANSISYNSLPSDSHIKGIAEENRQYLMYGDSGIPDKS